MIHSLQLRLSVLLIVAVTGIVVIFGFAGRRQLAAELNADFAQMQKTTLDRLAGSLVTPLWDVNREAIEDILKAEMTSREIIAMRVLDLGGQVLAAYVRDERDNVVRAVAATPEPSGIFTMVPILRHGGTAAKPETIGQIAVVFSRRHLDAALQRYEQRQMLQVLAIDIELILLLILGLRMVFRPLGQLRDGLMTLARHEGEGQGEISELPESRDRELGDVARGFNLTLRRIREEAFRQEAMLAGKAKAGELSRLLQNADDYPEFGQQLLRYLAPWLGAEVAAFFVREDSGDCYRCVAGYGIAPANCAAFRPGEGLGGEAVLGGKSVMCHDVPETYLTIEAATLAVAPHTIAVVPVLGGTGVLAVLEFGYLQDPRYQDEILADALPVIAFSLELLLRKRATLKDLKARTTIEERQRLILASIQDGLFGQDLDGCVTFVNDATLRMLGFTEAELIGHHMHALTHHHRADGREFPREECSMFLTSKDGRARTVTDEVFWRKDGTCFPIEYTTTPLSQDGAITGAVITFRDITERKAAETALRTSQKQIRTLVDSIGSVITLKDAAGRYLLLNAFYQKAMGIQEQDVLGKTAFDLLPREVAEGIQAAERRVMETLTPLTYEETIPRRDGSGVRHYMTTKTPLVDDRGVAYGICSIAIDITERRDQEQKLNEAMELQQSIFDNIPAGVFLTADGLIRQVNPGLTELLRAGNEVLVGKPASIVFPSAEAYAAFGARVGPLLGQGLPICEEVPFCRRDGSSFVCRISGRPITLSGFSRSAIWLLEDITELRQNEERLRSILDDSPLGVTILTEDGEQTYVNQRMTEIFGVSAEELKKKRTTEFWCNPADREVFIDDLRRNGKVSNFEAAMRRADGSELRALLNTRYIDLHGGRFLLTWFYEITDGTDRPATVRDQDNHQ